MIRKFLSRGRFQICPYGILFLFFVISTAVFAQEGDLQSAVNHKVNKMQAALNLTDSQAYAIRPVVKDYLAKRMKVLEENNGGGGIMDHSSVKNSLRQLKQDEYQKLSRILNKDQMKKWIDRENLMAALNPDGAQGAVDEGPGLTLDGANFKF